MSLDLSQKSELQPLAHLVADLRTGATRACVPFLLIGATARDLLMHHVHGVPFARKTVDVDFAVAVESWKMFERLHELLVSGEGFRSPSAGPKHRLVHRSTSLPVDIVPFGNLERLDRTIEWPGEHRTALDCFGLSEAMAAGIPILLPGMVSVRVASIPALTILKSIAWSYRRDTDPGRDASDLSTTRIAHGS